MSDILKKLEHLIEYYSETMQEFGDTPFAAKIKIDSKNFIQTAKPIPNLLPKKDNTTPIIVEKKAIIPQNIPHPMHNINISDVKNLSDLKKVLSENIICEIQKFATNIVLGDGNPNAKVMIIGEAPGQEEDEHGVPFCGRSGQLLMNAFACIGLERSKNFFITNTVFFRPPGNRNPTDEEISACRPFLQKIAEIIKPEVIICVGAVAAKTVINTEQSISSMRGKIFTTTLWPNAKVFCIYHPSYLLRNPSKKYDMYKDLLGILPEVSHFL